MSNTSPTAIIDTFRDTFAQTDSLAEAIEAVYYSGVRDGIKDPRQVLAVLCAELGVSYNRVRSRSREAGAVAQRRTVWKALRAKRYSYPEIGKMTGHDHSTVMFGLKRAAA